MEDEVWKDVKGYEGFYQVSDKGRIRSVDRMIEYKDGAKHFWSGRVLKLSRNKNGYYTITLYKEGAENGYGVHRLVAQAFIPNLDNLPQVNHKNEVKTDNRAENLEWCSMDYNINYGTIGQRISEKRSKQVYQYTLDNQLVKVWKSTQECGRNGYNQRHISECCRGVLHKHKGFRWSYKPLEAPSD